jgi:uncharacterized membrane protein YfcA
VNNLEMWSLIVGFLLPIVIAFIQQEKWSEVIRSVTMFIVCVIAATGTVYFSGHFNLQDLVTSALLIIVTAIGTYKGIWQPTGIAPALEHVTSASHSTEFHSTNVRRLQRFGVAA